MSGRQIAALSLLAAGLAGCQSMERTVAPPPAPAVVAPVPSVPTFSGSSSYGVDRD